MHASAPGHTTHLPADDRDCASITAELTRPDRAHDDEGVHVVVHVAEGGNEATARIVDRASAGDGSGRVLTIAPRGASRGRWAEPHHPRAEAALGLWRAHNADALDRLLIQRGKVAWRLDHTPPYVVEFAPEPTASTGIAELP